MLLPIMEIVMGAIFSNDCPYQKMIPKWSVQFRRFHKHSRQADLLGCLFTSGYGSARLSGSACRAYLGAQQ